jgi:hypothetical protein
VGVVIMSPVIPDFIVCGSMDVDDGRWTCALIIFCTFPRFAFDIPGLNPRICSKLAKCQTMSVSLEVFHTNV